MPCLNGRSALDGSGYEQSMHQAVAARHCQGSHLPHAERLAPRDIVAQSYTFGFLPQSPDDSDAESINLAAGEEALEATEAE